MLFISIIAVNLPLLITLEGFTCDPDLENGVCGFSTTMAEAYYIAMYVLSSLMFHSVVNLVFANMSFWVSVFLPSSQESLPL
jgi:hypothetical protein